MIIDWFFLEFDKIIENNNYLKKERIILAFNKMIEHRNNLWKDWIFLHLIKKKTEIRPYKSLLKREATGTITAAGSRSMQQNLDTGVEVYDNKTKKEQNCLTSKTTFNLETTKLHFAHRVIFISLIAFYLFNSLYLFYLFIFYLDRFYSYI